ncbi:MAG: hypothetical protein LQ345_004846 [Seirophora villosa]|nr:MAG: hypothetical protein LQ345_004846 [Seirophora villosa]
MATEPSAPSVSDAKEGQQLMSILNTISTDSIQNEGEKCQTLLAAYALVSRLETPWEVIARLCMGQPVCYAIWLQIDCSDRPMWIRSSQPLSLKTFSSQYTGSGSPICMSSHLSRRQNSESRIAYIRCSYDATIPCFFKLLEYLARTGYQAPSDPANGVFQYTKGWECDAFDYFKAYPR